MYAREKGREKKSNNAQESPLLQLLVEMNGVKAHR